MCHILPSQLSVRTPTVRPSQVDQHVEVDSLLRDLAYVFRLTEQVRESLTARPRSFRPCGASAR
jgi:hypothetical protein